jgi:hypothetical protein
MPKKEAWVVHVDMNTLTVKMMNVMMKMHLCTNTVTLFTVVHH